MDVGYRVVLYPGEYLDYTGLTVALVVVTLEIEHGLCLDRHYGQSVQQDEGGLTVIVPGDSEGSLEQGIGLGEQLEHSPPEESLWLLRQTAEQLEHEHYVRMGGEIIELDVGA